jgi:hypothetical protein
MPERLLWLILAVLAMAGIPHADVIVEWSGREWTGELVSTDDSTLTFRASDGRVLLFDRRQVERMAFRGPVRAAPRDIVALDGQGHTELAAFGSMYGMANGLMLASVANFGGRARLMAAFTGCVSGFYLSERWSRSRSVGDGRAELLIFGGMWGLYQGLGWPLAFWARASHKPWSDMSLVSGMLGGAAGVVTAGLVTTDREFSAAEAAVITSVPSWCTVYSFWAGPLAHDQGADMSSNAAVVSTLIVGNLGLIGGALLARHVELSSGDIQRINICGAMGAATGGFIATFAGAESVSAVIGAVMAGALAGKLLAWRLWTGSPSADGSPMLKGMRVGPTLVGQRPVRAGRRPELAGRRLTPAIGASFSF